MHHGGVTPRLNDLEWPVRTLRLTSGQQCRPMSTPPGNFVKLPTVGQWITNCPSSLAEYRSRFEDPDRMAETLVIELDGAVIGDLMLAIQDAWAQSEVKDQARSVQAELGWCLSPAHQGHGYATEPVSELIRICFEALGLRRITAKCFVDNAAS